MTYRNLLQFEASIVGSSIRKWGICDSRESEVLDLDTFNYNQTFPDKYSKLLKGKILTYNSLPDVTSLFDEDVIDLSITFQFKELRAVSKSGTYSLISPSFNWPTKETIFDALLSSTSDKELFDKDYCEQQHIRWENAAKKLGLKYKRFPPYPCLDLSCEEFDDN